MEDEVLDMTLTLDGGLLGTERKNSIFIYFQSKVFFVSMRP